jgi:hypothetical protein
MAAAAKLKMARTSTNNKKFRIISIDWAITNKLKAHLTKLASSWTRAAEETVKLNDVPRPLVPQP